MHVCAPETEVISRKPCVWCLFLSRHCLVSEGKLDDVFLLLCFQVEYLIPLMLSGVIDALSEFSTAATILIRPSVCSSSPIPRPCGPGTDISYLPLRPAVNVVLPFARLQQPREWVLLRCLLPCQRLLWRTGGIGQHRRYRLGRPSTAGWLRLCCWGGSRSLWRGPRGAELVRVLGLMRELQQWFHCWRDD